MATADAPPTPPAIPADDETEDARWLASLITALRDHADRAGHPEVVTVLDDALAAAQAIVDGETEH